MFYVKLNPNYRKNDSEGQKDPCFMGYFDTQLISGQIQIVSRGISYLHLK